MFKPCPSPRLPTGEEKVAVIGSGPAGLDRGLLPASVREGFQVTIFEALDRFWAACSGLGIPDYRLPPEVLNREIARTSFPWVSKPGPVSAFGKDITFDSLNSGWIIRPFSYGLGGARAT